MAAALNGRRLLLLYLRRCRSRRHKYVKRFWVRPKRFCDILNEFHWLLVFFVRAIRKYCSNYLTSLQVFASSLRAVFAMSGKEPYATCIIELPMPMYMHTNCLLFASCNKLLNNSTFYHLKSLIALAIGMIRILRGCPLPIPPQVSLLSWFYSQS
jgi:hypothetical protein